MLTVILLVVAVGALVGVVRSSPRAPRRQMPELGGEEPNVIPWPGPGPKAGRRG